jgi:hypothetical protein
MIFTPYLCGVKRGFKDRTWFEGVEKMQRKGVLLKRGEVTVGRRKLHSGNEKLHNLYALPSTFTAVIISTKSRMRSVGQVVCVKKFWSKTPKKRDLY